MKPICCCFLLAFLLYACASEPPNVREPGPFTIGIQTNPEWQKGKLRLYPIYATEAFVAKHERLAQYKVLGEALKNERFRIVEHKPFGRFAGTDVVNRLTVENRSSDTVFLMSGDIIRGGRQDRVVADDQIVASRQIKNMGVFCVEKNRSSFPVEAGEERNENAAVYAFRDYYNVAPAHLRKPIRDGDQEGVWQAIAAITNEHEATNSTAAYAALEEASHFTRERDAYLAYFTDLLSEDDGLLVGLVAVSGEKIIGLDVFGHTALAKARFPSLLPGYITEALTYGASPNIPDHRIHAVSDLLHQKLATMDAYFYDGLMVHLSNI